MSIIDVECNFMLPIKSSNWRIKRKRDYQSIDPIVPTSFRIKTNIEAKLSNRKLEDFQRRQMNQTYRASKRYSSNDLQFRIRSKIISAQKFDPTNQLQQSGSANKLLVKFHIGENTSHKKKYVLNFYHKSRQFSIRRQSIKANVM